MTREDVRDATAEAVVAAEQLAAHLGRMMTRMAALLPIEAIVLASWDDEPRERLHALLRMFEQLFDLTSRKLFRGALFLSGEMVTGLSARNQFRRMEALGALASADRWIEIATTRNVLVHDYPVNAVDQAGRANRAWQDLPVLIDATNRTIALIRSEGLLA